MKKNFQLCLFTMFFLFLSVQLYTCALSEEEVSEKSIDEKVRAFLESRSGTWIDANVPLTDGKLLYDLIIKNNYTKALEIGTSTGHSGIWIAWALSKTGGKMITIEINEGRYREALSNFNQSGLSEYIDARLADAHEMVKELEGPFDFIFSDADKYWYKNYFIDLDPKLEVDGCFTAHNVSGRMQRGIREFLDHVRSLPYYETTIDRTGGGISISYKKSIK